MAPTGVISMYCIIDGHNLIGQMPDIHLDDPHDEVKLLDYLRRYRARTGHHVVVVFDAGLTYHPAQTKKQRGVTIQFAPRGRSADQIILKRMRRVQNPQGTMVISSDRDIQQAARTVGIRVVSARDFARQLIDITTPHDESAESRADLHLTPAEVEEWLAVFRQRKK